MEMKRILALILALVMVAALFVGCSGEKANDDPAKTDATDPVKTDPADPTDPTDPTDPVEPGKTLKVGMVCIGDENDQGYTYNFIRGKESATEALAAKGINVDWVVKYNIGEDSTCEDANIELAEEGCELIFNNSYGFEPFML